MKRDFISVSRGEYHALSEWTMYVYDFEFFWAQIEIAALISLLLRVDKNWRIHLAIGSL